MSQLRPTEEGDLARLSDLYKERFGHPLTAEEWRWKYRALPGEAESVVAVDDAGRVVAHAGALKLPARWAGGEGGIWQLTDFLGSTRGAGLKAPLVSLGRSLLERLGEASQAPWIFGFPSERHFQLGERVFGYGPLAEVTELAGDVYQAAALAGRAEVALEVGDRGGDWVEEIWEACGPPGAAPLGVRRSAAFLDWRYWARPGRYYRFYRVRGEGGDGLAVFAFVGSEALAAELWLPAGRGLASALPAIAGDLVATGLERWRFWPPPPGGEPGALDGLGLAPRAQVFIGCRGREGAGSPAPSAEGFFFAMGDHDIT